MGRCHGNRVSNEWQIFSSILSLFFNISIFPRWNFLKLSYLVKMIWTNILQVKKYGVVQTGSPISRDLLFLAIKLNCSDRFSSKTDTSQIAFVSQNVQSFKKIHRRKREKIHCWLCFFWLCWRHKLSGKTYVFMWARADYWSSHHQRARGPKTIGSHLKKLKLVFTSTETQK